MNLKIVHKEVQDFITQNLTVDISKIILKGSPFEGITVQELANQIQAKKKSQSKLPTWFTSEAIYYPSKISIEQTSSEITANYKANLISGNNIMDLTGGFGIDSYYFAKQFTKVVHCEINEELSKIVQHNFNQLKASNIVCVAGNGLTFLKETSQTFDCIYIDPSRRTDHKEKVFLLKDCAPNIPPKLDFLFTKTANILLKNSPILDITSTINELQFVKEIHVVAIQNEVKELLFLLEKDYDRAIEIKTVNILKNRKQQFNYLYNQQKEASYSEPRSYLYEPNAAILKSGGFQELSAVLQVAKLQQHSHLYTSETLIDFPGRSFEIVQVLNYDKKKLKRLIPDKKANITTRNFPKSVAQIRKETNLKEGGALYLFFTTNTKQQKIVIVCRKTL